MVLKGDTKRKKWEYFKDYYLRTVLLCAVLIAADDLEMETEVLRFFCISE